MVANEESKYGNIEYIYFRIYLFQNQTFANMTNNYDFTGYLLP